MSGWREMLLDVLKLTDTVSGLNKDVEKLDNHHRDLDKRLVRLETIVEFSSKINSVKVTAKDVPD